jgi:UDP-glucose 4-epimerase
MNILVTGGAGYIGSHMVRRLVEAGHRVTVLDDLSGGHAEAVAVDDLVVADIASPFVDEVLRSRRIEAVMHFAALIQVAESVSQPARYYDVNVTGSLRLFDAMVRCGVNRLIFSSTAAVYGDPVTLPMDEAHTKLPINPYGATKWMIEQALADYRRAYGLRSVSLRYFNAAGAHPDGTLGSLHPNETHLVPLLMQALSGRRSHLSVFGTDYATRDGTCLRDYIHVMDLCEAHLLALQALGSDALPVAFNLGTGQGCTVLEALDAAHRVVGRAVPVIMQDRRPGDPASLLADASLARRVLGWTPRLSDIATILRHAWAWEETLCRRTQTGPRPAVHVAA